MNSFYLDVFFFFKKKENDMVSSAMLRDTVNLDNNQR